MPPQHINAPCVSARCIVYLSVIYLFSDTAQHTELALQEHCPIAAAAAAGTIVNSGTHLMQHRQQQQRPLQLLLR